MCVGAHHKQQKPGDQAVCCHRRVAIADDE